MSYSIRWSPRARVSYLNILEYLSNEWSSKEIETFSERTVSVLNGIRQNPSLYEYSEKSDTHRCVLTNQITSFYRVKSPEQNIELLVFWDTRQDPDRLNVRD